MKQTVSTTTVPVSSQYNFSVTKHIASHIRVI